MSILSIFLGRAHKRPPKNNANPVDDVNGKAPKKPLTRLAMSLHTIIN